MEASHRCENGYLTIILLDRHYYTNNNHYYGNKKYQGHQSVYHPH